VLQLNKYVFFASTHMLFYVGRDADNKISNWVSHGSYISFAISRYQSTRGKISLRFAF